MPCITSLEPQRASLEQYKVGPPDPVIIGLRTSRSCLIQWVRSWGQVITILIGFSQLFHSIYFTGFWVNLVGMIFLNAAINVEPSLEVEVFIPFPDSMKSASFLQDQKDILSEFGL